MGRASAGAIAVADVAAVPRVLANKVAAAVVIAVATVAVAPALVSIVSVMAAVVDDDHSVSRNLSNTFANSMSAQSTPSSAVKDQKHTSKRGPKVRCWHKTDPETSDAPAQR